MTLRTLETLTFWFGAAAICLSVLTAAAGGLGWYFRTARDTARDNASSRYKAESEARIAEATAHASDANRKAAEANQLAENFRLDIAHANERAAQANVTAERERVARLQLEARLAPRVIPPPRMSAMTVRLRTLGSFAVQLYAYDGSLEVQRLFTSLCAVITSAGWPVGSATMASGGVSVQGIVIAVTRNSSAEVRRAADVLIDELRLSGIGASLAPRPLEEIPEPNISMGTGVAAQQIRVLVGSK